MSKQYGDFHCLNCLYSFETKNKHEPHKYVCQNKDFCNVGMPFKDAKILDKVPFIIYADFECLKEKIVGCKYNPEIHLKQK